MYKKYFLISLVSIIMSGILNAAEVSLEEEITGLYVAFFNRAADENGLTYWKERGEEASQKGENVSDILHELAAGFAQHPSFDRAYGALENKNFAEAVYRNTLGRDGDKEGITYWTKLLNEGMKRSDFVSVFVEAALTFESSAPQYANLSPEDLASAQLRRDLIANKVEVALEFTQKLGAQTNVKDNANPEEDPAYMASVEILSNITEDHTTVGKKLLFLNNIIEKEKDPISAINKSATAAKTEVTRTLLAGKTFHTKGRENSNQSEIFTMIFNDDTTQFTKIRWDKSREKSSIKIVGNKMILINNGGDYTIISQIDDYLHCDERYMNGTKKGEGYRLYKGFIEQLTLQDTWQWQLSGTINTDYHTTVYEIDLFETKKNTIDILHHKNVYVVCYFSAGSYENWREDIHLFEPSVIGKQYKGWESESWLDIRSENVKSIMQSRLDRAMLNGCDAVEADNVHGFDEDTGFSLTAKDQLEYNRFLAKEAHLRGLGIALKNDAMQVSKLVDDFDFSVTEEIFQTNEFDQYTLFIKAGKAVFNAEYASMYITDLDKRREMCKKSNALNVHTLILPLDLDDSFRYDCWINNGTANTKK